MAAHNNVFCWCFFFVFAETLIASICKEKRTVLCISVAWIICCHLIKTGVNCILNACTVFLHSSCFPEFLIPSISKGKGLVRVLLSPELFFVPSRIKALNFSLNDWTYNCFLRHPATQTNKHPAHRTIQTSMTIKYLIPRAHTNYEICSSIPTAAACAVVSLGNSTLLFLFRWKACFSFQLTCRLTTIFLLFCGCNPSFQSNLSSANALVWIRWRFI